MKIMTKLDYVELYARELKKDSSLFKQQKMLIDSQVQGSRTFFKNMFSGDDYYKCARAYLKGVGLL